MYKIFSYSYGNEKHIITRKHVNVKNIHNIYSHLISFLSKIAFKVIYNHLQGVLKLILPNHQIYPREISSSL